MNVMFFDDVSVSRPKGALWLPTRIRLFSNPAYPIHMSFISTRLSAMSMSISASQVLKSVAFRPMRARRTSNPVGSRLSAPE